MKLALALFFYAAALFMIWAGFAVPGSEGLNHHVMPQGDAEWLAALMIASGCSAKLLGHVLLLSWGRVLAR